MTLADKLVATEADAIHALALVKAGVSVSSGSMDVVTDWCAWEVGNLKDAISALVPGQAATAVQTALAAAQVALNSAGDNSLSPLERFLAVVKARDAVDALELVVLG